MRSSMEWTPPDFDGFYLQNNDYQFYVFWVKHYKGHLKALC